MDKAHPSTRELSDQDARRQAEALRAFVSRGGDPEMWWSSKGFTEADRRLIAQEANMRRGDAGRAQPRDSQGRLKPNPPSGEFVEPLVTQKAAAETTHPVFEAGALLRHLERGGDLDAFLRGDPS